VAELTIRLIVDAETGKKDILIGYHSDADALPIEHEDEHRRLVEKLVAGGLVKAEEIGKIKVEREGAGTVAEGPVGTEPQGDRVKQKTT
jgi:hypothetical protein